MNWDSERFFQEAINLIDAKFMAKIEKEALEDREIVTKTMIEKIKYPPRRLKKFMIYARGISTKFRGGLNKISKRDRIQLFRIHYNDLVLRRFSLNTLLCLIYSAF